MTSAAEQHLPICQEGDGDCTREAAAWLTGMWSQHYVCLSCAQRHVNLDWPAALEWLVELPGRPAVTMIGRRA